MSSIFDCYYALEHKHNVPLSAANTTDIALNRDSFAFTFECKHVAFLLKIQIGKLFLINEQVFKPVKRQTMMQNEFNDQHSPITEKFEEATVFVFSEKK